MAWIHDQIYAAGGIHIPATWAEFADQTGVTAVLHLSPGRPARFDGPPPGVFLWLDVDDETQVGLEERHLAGQFMLDCLTAGRRVLLHSSSGRHRTRWAYVAFCIYTGRSVRTALRQAAERPWLSPYHTDADTWQAFADVVRANPSAGSKSMRRGGLP